MTAMPIARRLAALAALVAAVAACDTDRATLTAPLGRDIVNGRFAPDGRNLPNGLAQYVNWNEDADIAEDEVFITLAGLESLSTGRYHLWLARVVGDTVRSAEPLSGALFVTTADTVFDALGDIASVETIDTPIGTASSFSHGGSNRTMTVIAPAPDIGAYNTILVTIETAAATQPTTTGARPLWTLGLDDAQAAAVDDGEFVIDLPLSFGTFQHERTSRSYVFAPVGRGLASFFDERQMTIADSALARPPVGYYYASSLIARNLARVPTDTLVIGEQTAPAPRRSVSLRDADVTAVDPVVLSTSILAAANLLRVSSGTPFRGFTDVTVHLEAKAGIDLVSPSQVLVAPVPGVIGAAGTP